MCQRISEAMLAKTYRQMRLKLIGRVRAEKGKLPSDHRRTTFVVVASYRGEDGHEYRKAFHAIGHAPIVPAEGTHEQLNAIREQLS